MNYYLTAFEGMPRLLEPADVLDSFTKKRYREAFDAMYRRHVPTFEALESGYRMVIDKDQFLFNMAEALVKEASGRLSQCRRRSERERLMMNLNLQMVVFVLPMILEFKGDSSGPLTEKVLAAWKREFPKTNLQAASCAEIEQGFHKKFCYITTAACQVLDRPDDCRELALLREYRDGYMASLPDGQELIRRYYDVAPTIVKHIDRQEDPQRIYRQIWDRYLEPCIRMIESGQPEACRELYQEMVNSLEETYFIME